MHIFIEQFIKFYFKTHEIFISFHDRKYWSWTTVLKIQDIAQLLWTFGLTKSVVLVDELPQDVFYRMYSTVFLEVTTTTVSAQVYITAVHIMKKFGIFICLVPCYTKQNIYSYE